MITLGIETSCDETAAALIEDGRVLSSEISSSVHLHSHYGGVVPEIASRYHTEYISSVLKKALTDAKKSIKDIDLISVTREPGLPGSLLVGRAFAKALSYARGIPLVEVDHLKAHVLSCFLDEENLKEKFPFIGVVISGGHTSIYICRTLEDFQLIGRTKDDAVGEAFDKVAKMMNLGYPGGPIVEKRAADYDGNENINFPRALLENKTDLDFSFSGLKTAVMYHWRDSEKTESERNKICFSFQDAIIDVIDRKILRAIHFANIKKLAVGGGVVNNAAIRERLTSRCKEEGIELYLPRKIYCGDNAAMIAALGEGLHKHVGTGL